MDLGRVFLSHEGARIAIDAGGIEDISKIEVGQLASFVGKVRKMQRRTFIAATAMTVISN